MEDEGEQGNCNCSHQLAIEKPHRWAATAKCHELWARAIVSALSFG